MTKLSKINIVSLKDELYKLLELHLNQRTMYINHCYSWVSILRKIERRDKINRLFYISSNT